MYLQKPVRIMLKGSAKEAFLKLKKQDDEDSKRILKSIDRLKEILRDNPQYGDVIGKKKIPKAFQKLNITNLYRAELSNYWRMLYTIQGNKVEIFLFVLTISDHKEYNKIMGYKKR